MLETPTTDDIQALIVYRRYSCRIRESKKILGRLFYIDRVHEEEEEEKSQRLNIIFLIGVLYSKEA